MEESGERSAGVDLGQRAQIHQLVPVDALSMPCYKLRFPRWSRVQGSQFYLGTPG